MTSRTPKPKAKVEAADETVCRYKANPGRGEVATIIEGKHCLFVPNYMNIAAIEDEIGGSVLNIITEMSSGNIIVSKVVPILVHLNDGDPLTHDEAYRWLSSVAQGDEKSGAMLINIMHAVIDPQGNRFKAVSKDEAAAEDPNA